MGKRSLPVHSSTPHRTGKPHGLSIVTAPSACPWHPDLDSSQGPTACTPASPVRGTYTYALCPIVSCNA
jgi:hypothetical protein